MQKMVRDGSPFIIRFCFPHKTASMFAYKVLAALAKQNQACLFSPNNSPSNHTQLNRFLTDQSPPAPFIFLGPSRVYLSSASLQSAILDHGYQMLSVHQTRDPLDIFISQFFSHGWIHPDHNWSAETISMRQRLQAGDVSIFEYAHMEIDGTSCFAGVSIVEKMQHLDKSPAGSSHLIVTYDEFYNDYGAWSEKISSFLPKALGTAVVLANLQPDNSKTLQLAAGTFYANPLDYVAQHKIVQGRHVRSPAPGDHLHFLTPDEIDRLRSRLATLCPILVNH